MRTSDFLKVLVAVSSETHHCQLAFFAVPKPEAQAVAALVACTDLAEALQGEFIAACFDPLP